MRYVLREIEEKERAAIRISDETHSRIMLGVFLNSHQHLRPNGGDTMDAKIALILAIIGAIALGVIAWL